MVRGLYTASSGMINEQKRMDVIANNLANVNTTGFKKDSVAVQSFEDVLTVRMNGDSPVRSTVIGKMTLGARVGDIYTDYSQGTVRQTNESLDFAINGNGFFTVGYINEQGQMEQRYTRDGSFTVNADGDLTTKDGFYVLDSNGQTINIPNGEISVVEDGTIYVNGENVGQLNIVDFDDKENMLKIGDNLYEYIGEGQGVPADGQIIQGYLEQSNVNIISEMVDMINVMRSYEASQKVIQTQDETLGKAVNEIGRI